MNKREAAIISAYTGVMVGDFGDMHKYIEEILERPVFTHELGSQVIVDLIKKKSKDDLLQIHENITET